MAKVVKERQMIFTTEAINSMTDKLNDGVILKRYENPWLKSEIGIRRSGISFKMTPDEQAEYIRCALDIHYFVEKYCHTKREDGTVGKIKLRPYQRDILDNFMGHRFNILMSSRQSGKTISASIFILHFILFNNDKNVMIVANKGDTATEIVDKIKSIYSLIPFFLKPGIKVWNQKSLTFDNGCRIKTSARTKTPAIGFTIDLLFLDEFAHIPANIIEPYYTAVYPVTSGIKNSKIIITSTPNGMNLFHKLLVNAERPDGDPLKNNYKAMRVYWHQVDGRFVTYLRLNSHKLFENELSTEDVFEMMKNKFGAVTKVEIEFNVDLQKDVISIFNNDKCTEEQIRASMFLDSKGYETSIIVLGEITTWKEEAIKDIGGEDAFNQEYGLRFVNSGRSLLSESIIDELLKNKKNYIHTELFELENKLKFSYKELKWVDDDYTFSPIRRNDYKFVISVDIAEGLGIDYSIINIFKIGEKPKELTEIQKPLYKSMSDFFRLDQVGLFRSNLISVKQLAELLYMIVFEYLNPENVKVVLELNNYGNTLLAEMPHVLEGNNDYGSSVFVRYKQRVDAEEEKIGLKVGENKNLMVKDYQDLMLSKSFLINNEETIAEITSFVKHITAAGNVRYAGDGNSHDDTVMTIINSTSIFPKNEFKEMVEDWCASHVDTEHKNYINECLKNADFVEGVDYSQLLRIRRDFIRPKKDNTEDQINWFNSNR
jgi:hypothetical protein